MKKLFYTSAFFTLLPAALLAQFVPGIKLGGNYATCATTYQESPAAMEYHYGVGALAGATLDYFLSEQLSVRAELLVSNTGVKVEKMFGDRSQTTHRVTAINLPMMVKLRTLGSLFFTAGGMGAYRISKDILSFTGYNRLDFALSGGLGLDFGRHFGVELRYNHGVMAVGKTPMLYNEQPVGNFSTMNRCFQLTAEYRFANKEY